MTEGMGGSVDAEVRGYFDRLASTRWREGLRKRINEGSMLRLIGKGRRAGVIAQGALTHPETGVVQGGVLSPVWANVFLHQVLDAWFAGEGRPRMQGRCCLRRFADDCVIGGALEADARKIRAVLPQRFARFGLPIPPTQTALIAFRKPKAHQGSESGNGTCTLLGLTPYWPKSRQGFWVMKRRPASKRLRRTKTSLGRGGRNHRHAPRQHPYQRLGAKLRGHYQYDGMRGNCRLLEEVRGSAERAWRYWLRRRRRKSAMGWKKFGQLRQTSILPIPRSVHTI